VKNNKVRRPSPLEQYVSKLLSPTGNFKLSQSAKDKIEKLASGTKKGDNDAAAELFSTTAFAVEILTWMCKEQPEVFKEIARERFSWPVMYNPHPEKLRMTTALLRELELGRNTQINFSSGKTFSWEVPANVIAFNLYQLAESLRRVPKRLWDHRVISSIARCGIGSHGDVHRIDATYWKQMKALDKWGQRGTGKQLPPLSKKSAAQWAIATRELFGIAYPGNFEEHPNLQQLRESVLGRAENAYGKVRRGGIRKAMLQALKQAWHSIAALD
jgi:hypothetical protein